MGYAGITEHDRILDEDESALTVARCTCGRHFWRACERQWYARTSQGVVRCVLSPLCLRELKISRTKTPTIKVSPITQGKTHG
jgi:hypothetical protein